MKFVVEINCSNAAFDGREGASEVKRLLRQILAELVDGDAIGEEPTDIQLLRDVNGNHCGFWAIVE